MLRALSRITRRGRGAPPNTGATAGGVHEEALTAFRRMLGAGGVVTDPVALQGHNFDWFENRVGGKAAVALAPACTEQVSQVLAYCNVHGIPVVPQGAAPP